MRLVIAALAFLPWTESLLPLARPWVIKSSANRRGRHLPLFGAKASPDMNLLMTQINDAVSREDYLAAAALKEQLDALAKEAANSRHEEAEEAPASADWLSLGTPSWLSDRLADIDFTFATPCQANTQRALFAIKVCTNQDSLPIQ